MGRFEKRPENPRIRGELSRAAENALWDVVEDLENLQQNLLRSLQEDVKRLEIEKTRLSTDIQKLIEEKEQLQQSRQITEQQVLIRQLAEVLAKHISSQLQSSLKTLATQAVEYNPSDLVTLQNAQINNNTVNEIGQNVTNMLDSLDDNVTIAFNSLLQELKNYQGDLSQQLSRMYSQQQQGEAILAEFVNRLRSEVEKNRDANSLKVITGGPPTVLQLADSLRGEAITHQNGNGEKSSQKIIVEPVTLIPHQSPQGDSTSAANAVILSSPTEKSPEPSSFVNPDLPAIPENQSPELSSFVNPDLPAIPENQSPELSSFVNPDTSLEDKNSELSAVLTSKVLTAPTLGETKPEPVSVLTPNLSTGRPPTPKLRRETTSKQKTTPKQPATPQQPATPRQPETPRQQRSRTSPNWSQLQIGFLLICLSTVVSSLYNVAIKAIFFTASNPLGGLPTQQLIFPTLGNIFLILMLRLLVVVPLMLLLSPILHPPIWQELENLFASLRANATPVQNKTKQSLFLSVISGCLLFLSQVFIYIAIGEVTTGIAIALFFIYPVMSVFLSWVLFQERPSLMVTGAMAAIFCGELLVLGSQSVGVNNTSLGSTTAILSGIAFAIYVILTRICATKLKLHPVSLTSINFTTMLLLSFICLIIPLPSNLGLAISSSNILELVLSAFILGVLTLCGYLFNNFGIRNLGTPVSSLIGATVPILTVIFAGVMLQESLNIAQVIGVILVTVGAASISLKKTPNQLQPSE
ncbi:MULTISPECIES: EamA family transporter [Nostocales]|uniref:EamA family transporter n=1 Tax=Nostocales TaxID=1161 RepID=UPI00029B5E72|nr:MULTISPECIES: EamA family transporter [Nostocales]AFW93095.1 cell adhesion protein [Anabaena sp. 90]MTJ16914.1 EamA family transporter [Dolichospermum sp. UHCC 0299]MTJ22517.1 EamA family transporter [Dolichospermum sp. UHCC 0352]MTJ37834.1 EamA family transporter [Dolichospermum sp. UHCC 0406]